MTDLSAPTFSKGDAMLTFVFGVVMPSFDIFSDIYLSVKLFNRSCDEHEDKYWNCDNDSWIARDIGIQNTFGWWIILIPVLINLIFTIPQFLRLEKTWKQRLLTFPFLICLLWPQYRSMRVLWFELVKKDTDKCLKEKLDLEHNVSPLESFLEATPQVHIIIILYGVLEDDFDLVVITSLASSIFSSAFGIAKLLKNGPIKLIEKDGPMGGYLKPGFFILLVIVLGNMIGKVAWTSLASSPRSAQKTDVIWIWTLTCLLPQFLLTLLVWFINLGLKTFKFLCLYPSYFLLSIFSPFMVSGDSDSGLMTMAISKMWTLVNFSLSVIGTIVGIYVYDLYSNGALADVGYFTFVLKSVAIFLFTFVLAAILLALFFCCSCCTCSMEKTGIDVNDFDKIIDLQTGQKYGADVESNTRRTGQVYDGANNDAHLIMLNERIQRNETIEPIHSPGETDQECDDVNDEAIEAGSMIHPLESNAEETVDLDSPNLEEDLNIINGSVGDNDNPSETDQECVDANGEAIEAGSMIHPLASNIEKTVDLNSSDLEQDLEYVELNIINGSVGDNDNLSDAELRNSNTDQLDPNPSETDQECIDANGEAIEAGSKTHLLECNAQSGSTYIDEEVEERDGDNDNLSDAELSNSNNGPINSLLLLAKQY